MQKPNLYLIESNRYEEDEVVESEIKPIPELEEEEGEEGTKHHPEIALQALTGLSHASSLRFEVSLHGHKILILDSGTTHNYLDPKVARKLKIPLIPQ